MTNGILAHPTLLKQAEDVNAQTIKRQQREYQDQINALNKIIAQQKRELAILRENGKEGIFLENFTDRLTAMFSACRSMVVPIWHDVKRCQGCLHVRFGSSLDACERCGVQEWRADRVYRNENLDEVLGNGPADQVAKLVLEYALGERLVCLVCSRCDEPKSECRCEDGPR